MFSAPAAYNKDLHRLLITSCISIGTHPSYQHDQIPKNKKARSFLRTGLKVFPHEIFFKIHPVRDRNRFNLFFKYRLPMPDFKYFSLAVASCSFKHAS
jgi:hypothetical protein